MQRIAAASHYLVHMFVAVPAASGVPPSSTATASWVSRSTWGLLALGSWLVTVALGLWLMARHALRGRRARPRAARLLRRPPALNLAHLVLAGVSLLAWIVYLATAVTGVAWAAVGLLPLVAGLGMALLFLSYLAAPAASPDSALGSALGSAQGSAQDSAQVRRAPVLIVGAHLVFATATILFAALAAVGTG